MYTKYFVKVMSCETYDELIEVSKEIQNEKGLSRREKWDLLSARLAIAATVMNFK